MSYLDHHASAWEESHKSQSTLPVENTPGPAFLPNILTGVVLSKQEGLTRTTFRIRVGDRTDIRVRRMTPSPTDRPIEIGQPVRLVIPTEAVQLEAGGFRRSKQRWNRWIGRVVLARQHDEDPVITAKIHRDTIALKSRGPVIGARAALRTWDTVNIVIDPHQVRLIPLSRPSVIVTASGPSSFASPTPASVWLRATVRSIRSISNGQLMALTVGGATLSALIEGNHAAAPAWPVGASIDINISHSDTWIRRNADSVLIPCSIVLSSEIGKPHPPVSVRPTNL